MTTRTFIEEVELARKVWMEENPCEDGVDHVTPFDRFLYGTAPVEAQRCTCPSGDGSLRWPCPAHPPEAQPTPIGDLLADYEANGCDFTDLAWVRAAARRYVETMPDSQARCLLHVLAQEPAEAQEQGGGEVVAYAVYAKSEEYPKPVLLPEYVGSMEVIRRRVMGAAIREGFDGGFAERMAELGWWIEPLTLASAPPSAPAAQGGEEVYGLFRAIVDAGGPETIARHGVERGSREWTAKVRAGLLAIERQFHPERFDEPAPPSAPVGVEGLVWELRQRVQFAGVVTGDIMRKAADNLEALAQQPAADEEAAEQYRKGWQAGFAEGRRDQQPAAVDRRHPYVQSKDHGGCANCGYPEWEPWHALAAKPGDSHD